MSFGGHVLDMVNRTKQNRALKQHNRERRKKMIESYNDADVHHGMQIIDKNKLSEEEFVVYKSKLNKKYAKERRRMAILASFVAIVCLMGFYFLLVNVLF